MTAPSSTTKFPGSTSGAYLQGGGRGRLRFRHARTSEERKRSYRKELRIPEALSERLAATVQGKMAGREMAYVLPVGGRRFLCTGPCALLNRSRGQDVGQLITKPMSLCMTNWTRYSTTLKGHAVNKTHRVSGTLHRCKTKTPALPSSAGVAAQNDHVISANKRTALSSDLCLKLC